MGLPRQNGLGTTGKNTARTYHFGMTGFQGRRLFFASRRSRTEQGLFNQDLYIVLYQLSGVSVDSPYDDGVLCLFFFLCNTYHYA